jgi:hypothetical protein
MLACRVAREFSWVRRSPRYHSVVIRVPPGADHRDTAAMTHELETLALNHLRESQEPLREFALYDRVAADAAGDVTPDAFVNTMERLMTAGRVHVIADRDSSLSDPDPFQPRYYRLVE